MATNEVPNECERVQGGSLAAWLSPRTLVRLFVQQCRFASGVSVILPLETRAPGFNPLIFWFNWSATLYSSLRGFSDSKLVSFFAATTKIIVEESPRTLGHLSSHNRTAAFPRIGACDGVNGPA